MTREEAIEYAKNMTYQDAIRNTVYAKGVSYKKATRIKLHELAEIADKLVLCKDCRFWRNEHLCLVMSRYGSMDTKAEHYCSYGERRE